MLSNLCNYDYSISRIVVINHTQLMSSTNAGLNELTEKTGNYTHLFCKYYWIDFNNYLIVL